jgi:hypothetical protein
MNGNQRGMFRTGLIVLVAISLMLCSLSGGVQQGKAVALLGTPFQTVPPVNATLATPIGQATPMPTPLPTLGPGQYFENGDPRRPAVGITHGDAYFGWGYISGNPDLALIWMTDEKGTHYLVIDATSEWFLGRIDKDTNVREENGFEDFIRQMEDRTKQFEADAGQGVVAGLVANILISGLALCPETGGAACIGAVIVAAVTAIGTGLLKVFKMLEFKDDLAEIQTNIRGSFEILKVESTQ